MINVLIPTIPSFINVYFAPILSQALDQALVPEYSKLSSVSRPQVSQSNRGMGMSITTHHVSAMTDECSESLIISELDWDLAPSAFLSLYLFPFFLSFLSFTHPQIFYFERLLLPYILVHNVFFFTFYFSVTVHIHYYFLLLPGVQHGRVITTYLNSGPQTVPQ